MSVTLPEDALDPVIRKVAEVAGILDRDGAVQDAFLAAPLDTLAEALSHRQQEVIELLGMLLSDRDAEVLGLPAGGTDDHWIAVPDGAGAPTGLFVVLTRRAPRLHLGLGWKWEVVDGDVTVRTWAHVPLLSTEGSSDSTRADIATAAAPVRIGAEVTLANGFGAAGLRFRGVRGSISVAGTAEPPDVALVLLGLELGDAPPQDRSLADLAALPATGWIETALALFTAQLSEAGADTAPGLVRRHLLPLLGVAAPAPLPRLKWEQLPTRGAAVFDEWFAALTAQPAVLRAWLEQWQGLLAAGVGGPAALGLAGSGTRADPWRAGVSMPGGDVLVSVTAALEPRSDGSRVFYPGLRVGAAPIAVGAGALRLEVAASAELAAIPIGGTGVVSGLPSLALRVGLGSTTGTLVEHEFGDEPLARLGTLRVASLEAGLAFDAQRQPVPQLVLRDVQCARGHWPLLDLTAADAILDGLGAAASDLIREQLERGLALAGGAPHAGRRLAALLGIVAPAAADAPAPWPVTLVTDAARITQFLGDPMGAVARYHAACLTTDIDGAPAWRFLLAELGALLRAPGAGTAVVGGSGTDADPWIVRLGRTQAGDASLRAHFALDGARPQLRIGAALDPAPLPAGPASLALGIRAELLHLALPDPDGDGAAAGTWLPGLRAELRVGRADGVVSPALGALRIGADALALALEWAPASGAQWSAALDRPWAEWAGARADTLQLPPLRLGSAGADAWALGDAALGGTLGAVSRDAVAELARFVIGHVALEHGGPAGFGLSALLGLLPADPGLALPSWRGAAGPFELPDDFPVLAPADWGAFFADPWPTVRVHLGHVLAEPRHAGPVLRWLAAALQGLAPRRAAGPEPLTYERARGRSGYFTRPDGSADDDADVPLGFPDLGALPIDVRGSGTFERPYALGLRDPTRRAVEGLLWLDPDGPPAASAVDAAVAALAPGLRDLTSLGGAALDQLLDVLGVLARIDDGLAAALGGSAPALAGALGALEEFLRTSDGVVLTASQQPGDASWQRPAPIEALHTLQPATPPVIEAVRAQLTTWDATGSDPVLLLTAPFGRNDGWQALAGALGSAAVPFTYRVAGVAPGAVSLATLGGTPHLVAAELAVYDSAPGLAAAARVIPVDGPAGTSSQADQVVRLVERLRALHPGRRVIVVAHSASGLAARAAVQREGLAAQVRGVITVGTPHLGAPLTWRDDPTITEAVGALRRLHAILTLDGTGTAAIDALWQLIAERDLAGEPLSWPGHAFTPTGPQALPAGVAGLAIACRLPGTSLRAQLAAAIATRATQLRTALAARAPVTHIGVGVQLAPRPVTSEPTLDIACSARLDVARFAVAAGDGARPLPRLLLSARLRRPGGWLAGGPDARVRVRWAELRCEITADGVNPDVRLYDAAVDGVERELATLHRTLDGSLTADDILTPALDAVLARITAGAGASADALALARLLASFDVVRLREGAEGAGYALDPDGWSGLLADARGYGRRILAQVLADAVRRADLFARLRAVFGLAADGLGRLLADDPADPPSWRALRALLRAIGLLDDEARGSVPVLGAWLELVRSPAELLESRVVPLLHDADRRSRLLAELRAILDVRDVGQPVVDAALGGGVQLRVESLGKVALRTADAGVGLGGALSLHGALTLDLAEGNGSVALRLQPAAVTTGVRWDMTLPAAGAASWQLALDFGDGVRRAPLDALPLHPVPADLPARLGALLPRVTIGALATALLDSVVLARAPELAPVLVRLGLAADVPDGRTRVRNVARAIADPAGWLLSPQALGTADGRLDPASLAALARELATAFGLADDDGTVSLPQGLRIRTTAAPAAKITLDTEPALDLGSDVTVDLELGLGWTAAGELGAEGALDLRAPLPGGGPWPVLRVQAGYAEGGFRVALGADGALIQLLPFAGFDARALATEIAERLLPTLLEATLRALEEANAADVDVTALVDRIRSAAATLELDSIAGLDAVTTDPLAWVRRRFTAVDDAATDTASALRDILQGVPGVSADGGRLRFEPPGSPVAVTLGRNGAIGLGLELTHLDLGPVTVDAGFRVGINDAGPLTPVVEGALDISVDEAVIAPAGTPLTPSLHVRLDGAGIGCWLYPAGDRAGSPDFRLDVLPAFGFGVEDGATVESALVELARRVLVPLTIETFLDSADVTRWLNAPLRGALTPGSVLRDAGLLVANGGGWDLAALATLTDPRRIVEGLIGAALGAAATEFAAAPVIAFGDAGSGLFIASEGAGGAARRYGVRVVMPELVLSRDPEIILRLGGRTDWIAAAGHAAAVSPGIALFAVRDAGASASPRYSFDPAIELAGVGLQLSGRGDEPLFDVSGMRLGGVEALLFLRVDDLLGATSVAFGLYGDVQEIALPFGASDSNPVAASLMSGSNGDSEPVNPQFSLRAAYVNELWLEIGGQARNEVWFPVQRTFGPVSVQQVGVRWIGGIDSRLALLLDGGVALAGLAVGVDDLSLTVPLARITAVGDWQLGLRGLAVSYSGGGVRIAGGLLQASDEIRYDGFLLIEVGGRSFVALGSYGVVDGETSLFVFLVIGMPIGGPPYFFITGLAGGFGYNRALAVPEVERVPAFSLVAAMSDPAAVSGDPMLFLQRMAGDFPMERGSYWFAAGIKFTSFTLVNSQALLYVLLNRGLEIGILGMSQLQLPPAAPLVNVELALKARFSTIEGVISVEARLTDNSWLLSRECRLTGGFAFFLWFAGAHAGDFVISMGGYHPRYPKPAHYPDVPRLGFNWRVGSSITIKGEAYFALTPREVMAGGMLEASYQSGRVKAWFTAWANMYIQWRPFWFEVEIGVSIGVSVKTWLGTARAEVGASLWLWGPDIGGSATVELWIVEFTIRFGASRQKPPEKLSWADFRTQLLPPEDDKLYAGMVERGLITGSPATGPWVVLPEFVLRTEVFIGTSEVVFGTGVDATVPGRAGIEIDIRPMQVANARSRHIVRVVRRRDGADQTDRFQVREVLGGNVPRALWDLDAANPAHSIMPAHVGTRLVAAFDQREAVLDSTGNIKWQELFDDGPAHPLPFAVELAARATVAADAEAALGYDRFAAHADTALLAAGRVLHGDEWAARRQATLAALASEGVRVTASPRSGDVAPRGAYRTGRRSSPPLVRSLYEGLAAEPAPAIELREVVARERELEPPPARRPALEAVIRQRAEPTRAGEHALRTTVSGRLARGAPAADVQALLAAPITGATVLAAAPSGAVRETAIAAGSTTLRRGTGSTTRALEELDAIEAAAAPGRPAGFAALDTLTHVTLSGHVGGAGPGGRERGAPVEAGSTLRWSVPTRGAAGRAPTLHLAGDAAVRVVAMDRAGAPLRDVEVIGTSSLELPAGTAAVTVTGLGSSLRKRVEPGLGAVTLHEATSPVPVVGWQLHTPLVIAAPATLLARGATVRLAAPLTEHLDTGVVLAGVALAEQRGVTTMLPPEVRSVAIVLDEEDAGCLGDAADALAVSVAGGALAEAPAVVAAGARTVLLYDVIATDNDSDALAVSVAVSAAFTIAGVMGFAGPADSWAHMLATEDMDTLVENGPLAPTGVARLRFTLDEE